MPQASSSFASLCDRLLEAFQSERPALDADRLDDWSWTTSVRSILVPLLSLLVAAAWGLLLPQLLFAPPAPAESAEPDQAIVESRSEPDSAELNRAQPDRSEPDRAEPDRAKPDRVELDRAQPDRAASQGEEPEPLLTPTPPADGKPPEVLLAHTPESFVAAVRDRLGCRTQLPRKVYCAYFRSGVPTVTR